MNEQRIADQLLVDLIGSAYKDGYGEYPGEGDITPATGDKLAAVRAKIAELEREKSELAEKAATAIAELPRKWLSHEPRATHPIGDYILVADTIDGSHPLIGKGLFASFDAVRAAPETPDALITKFKVGDTVFVKPGGRVCLSGKHTISYVEVRSFIEYELNGIPWLFGEDELVSTDKGAAIPTETKEQLSNPEFSHWKKDSKVPYSGCGCIACSAARTSANKEAATPKCEHKAKSWLRHDSGLEETRCLDCGVLLNSKGAAQS